MRIFATAAGLVCVLALAACGEAKQTSTVPIAANVTTPAAHPPPSTTMQVTVVPVEKSCRRLANRAYRACETTEGPWQVAVTLETRVDGRWRVLADAPQHAFKRHGSKYWGMWDDVHVSPDASTLLVSWLVECDSSYAFFVPADGGKARLVTGKLDWDKSPQSRPVGWEDDGRAKVTVTPSCGDSPWKTGDYLIDPATGEAEFLG